MSFPGTTLVPVQFQGGLNSKIATFSLTQPYLQAANNAVYNLMGQIDKRTGFTVISNNIQGGGNISSGAKLTTFNNELILMDGKALYSYQEEEGVWINRGPIFATTNDQVRVLNTKIATQSNPDCTSSGNITIYVWEDNRAFPTQQNGVRYSVVNNVTGTIIVSDQFLYFAGTRPKVITDNTNFYVYFNASHDTILQAIIPVDRSNTVITTPFNFVCNNGFASVPSTQSIPYDACIYQGAPTVVYSGQSGIQVGSSVIVPLTSETGTINTIATCPDSFGGLWVCWSNNVNTYIASFVYQPTLNEWFPVLAPMTINRFTIEIATNIAMIEDTSLGSMNVTTEQAISGNNNFINNYIVSLTGISTFIGQARGVGLASKPFKYNGNVFVNTVWQSNLQATYFTQCLTQGAQFQSGTANIQAGQNGELATSFAIISKHSPQNGGNYRTNSILSQADPTTEGTYLFAGQRKGPFNSYQSAITTNLGVAGYSIIFDSENAFDNESANNNLHIVGGIKKIYDGVSCVEDNFNLFPENSDGYGANVQNITYIPPANNLDGYNQLNDNTFTFNSVVYSPAGNLTYNPLFVYNQYQWIVVYEWTDNQGNVQRSGPGVAYTAVTSETGQGAILVGPMLRLTEKVAPRSSVIISIYRSLVNTPQVYYKITNDNNPIANDPTTDQWIFVDTLSDAEIQSNENLYTLSQLPNISPPPCSLISLYNNRLMINSTEDPGVLWFSQNVFEQDQYNTLAMDWNTSFIEGVQSIFGNEITALAWSEQLVIFKETSIFLLSGDGPNALGTSGQFNDAQLLVADTGCNNQSSLVFITQTPKYPGGLLFKSPKGIYLLGRDESLTYIGAPVEAYNDLTITSANLLSQSNQVVFTTLEGTCLVYNYFFDAWTTWGPNLNATSACVWNDQLCILTANGNVMIQDKTSTVFSDTFAAGTATDGQLDIQPISLSITTPWINISDLQGYQDVFSCLLLATLQGPHVLQIQTAYDYNPSITASVLINSNMVANRWGSNPIWGTQGVWGQNGQFANYQFEIALNHARCESIQLVISDIPVDNNVSNQGYSLNGLVLECLTLPGPYRVPMPNKVGVS